MAYAGKCDRCGGFYDIPFEHGAPIRTRRQCLYYTGMQVI